MRVRILYKTQASIREDIQLQLHSLESTDDAHLNDLRLKKIIQEAYGANLMDWLIALEYNTLPREWQDRITPDEWKHTPALTACRLITNMDHKENLWPRSSERK